MTHKLSPTAKSDLDNIWLYIARETNSIDTAERVITAIPERLYLLTRHPSIGRHRDDDLRPGTRSFPVGSHVILYRVEEHEVLILRVIDGHREYLNVQLL